MGHVARGRRAVAAERAMILGRRGFAPRTIRTHVGLLRSLGDRQLQLPSGHVIGMADPFHGWSGPRDEIRGVITLKVGGPGP